MARAPIKLERWALIVTGPRRWHPDNDQPIRAALGKYPPGTLVLHGGANGVDHLADCLARELRQVPCPHPYFDECGKSGGQIRNALLAALLAEYRRFGYQTAVEAFRLSESWSVGTGNMVARAKGLSFDVFETSAALFGPLP